jgi:glutaredoxin
MNDIKASVRPVETEPTDRPRLDLYVRRDCHLCEDMLMQLRMLEPQFHFEIDVHDVDAREDWRVAYDTKVPILFLKDREICRYFLDQAGLLSVLDAQPLESAR